MILFVLHLIGLPKKQMSTVKMACNHFHCIFNAELWINVECGIRLTHELRF